MPVFLPANIVTWVYIITQKAVNKIECQGILFTLHYIIINKNDYDGAGMFYILFITNNLKII